MIEGQLSDRKALVQSEKPSRGKLIEPARSQRSPNREQIMSNLDQSQMAFCQSTAQNIRLLAPAGCGKTTSLLHRCRELAQSPSGKPRFLIVTFTVAATNELSERLKRDPEFEGIRDQATVTTLNAYGWRRIRSQVNSPRLLTTNTDRHFAMRNQLRPAWDGNQHIESVVTKPGSGARNLMAVIDNLKSMGFDHTTDTNRESFNKRLDTLEEQGLSWRIKEQFDLLTTIGVLDSPKTGDKEGPSSSRRDFYDRFFSFWRKATESLLGQSTFTFEDQKYWMYLDLKSPGLDGRRKPAITGAARYNHILVDEFQDINPLDLELIKAVALRNRSTLTIVGDDDQAIFEWRGATPEYILNPNRYFNVEFQDYQLEVNYRSPRNIVEHSQQLIANNENRVAKKVKASEDANVAEIEMVRTDSITERLKLVTNIVRSTEPGKVAVIGRYRSQLIPFQIYFASDGAPFKTAADLDVFGSKAFNDLIKLLEIWNQAQTQKRSRPNQIVNDVVEICNLIRRRPFGKKDYDNLRRYLGNAKPQSLKTGAAEIKDYDGPPWRGKTPSQLQDAASEFVTSEGISSAIQVIEKKFDGLQFDFERAEDDVFYTDPPLQQLADIAEEENLDADDLIDRIERAQQQIREYQILEDDVDSDTSETAMERPLHLMTAHRAKGKEFDTVILLDTVDGIWPHSPSDDQRKMEAERRLFYVAFTRARKKVIMLTGKDAGPVSPFVQELKL